MSYLIINIRMLVLIILSKYGKNVYWSLELNYTWKFKLDKLVLHTSDTFEESLKLEFLFLFVSLVHLLLKFSCN